MKNFFAWLLIFIATGIAPALAGNDAMLKVLQGGTGATTAAAARANLLSAQLGTNADITGLNALTSITPPASANYRVSTTGGHLITANDTSMVSAPPTTPGNFVVNSFYKITTPGNTDFTQIGALNSSQGTTFKATNNGSSQAGTTGSAGPAVPFQAWRLNYTVSQPWATDITGTASLAAISATVSSNVGAVYGKGLVGFNVSVQPVTGFDGHELYAAGSSIVVNQALTTASDFVAYSAGVTLNNTCELLITTGCHVYALFGTVNLDNALADTPIIHGVHVEEGIVSGAHAQYVNGVHVERNGSAPEAGKPFSDGSLSQYAQYTITTPGTTDFTQIGAPNNLPGTPFIATGPGSGAGNGVATTFPWSSAFAASAAGLGGSAQGYLYLLSLEDQVPHIGNPLPQPLNPNGGLFGYDNQTPCGLTGPIAKGAISAGGSGYVNSPVGNPYTLVPLTNVTSHGSGAEVNITVVGGVVTGVALLNVTPGNGYAVGDVLSASNTYLGNAGAGFTYTVTTVNPTCPTTLAHGFNAPNIFFSTDIMNLGGWVVDTTLREKIGTVSLGDLNPGVPATATDLLLTALTTRNAASAIGISIPSSDCSTGSGNDGCWLLKGGQAITGGVNGVSMYVPWFYNPPDGSLTVTGASKSVAGLTLSIGDTTVAPGSCGSLSSLSGLTKCLVWHIGTSTYYVPLGS